MPRLLAVLGVLAVLGLGLFVVLRDAGTRDASLDAPADAESRRAGADHEARRTSPEPGARGDARPGGEAAAPERPRSYTRLVLGRQIRESVAGGLPLVVTAADGSPAHQAVVMALTEKHRSREWLERAGVDLERLEAMAPRWLTDEAGEAVVERGDVVELAVHDGDGWAFAEHRAADPEPVLLQLGPIHGVAVEVVDEDEALVAGLPLLLRTTVGDRSTHHEKRSTSTGEAFPRATARFHGVETAAVGLALPTETVWQEIPLPLARDRRHRFTAPELAWLDVTFTTSDGSEVETAVTVVAAGVPETAEAITHRMEVGRVRVPVRPGRRLDVHLREVWGDDHHELRTVTAPKAGETLLVKFTLERRRHVLTGVLLDDDGDPLERGTRFSLRRNAIDVYHDNESYAGLEVGDEGRFSVELGRLAGTVGRHRFVLAARPGRHRLTVEFEHELTDDPASYDVGDRRLVGPTMLISGTVVDASGAAASDVSLDVLWYRNEPDRPRRTEIAYGRSDAEGRFELWGRAEGASELHLEVRSDVYHSDRGWRFVPGRTGQVVHVVKAALLEGRLRMPQGVPVDAVSLWVTSGLVTRIVKAGADGSFSVRVPHVQADVEARLDDMKAAVHRVRDIDTPRGRTTRPEALDPLDLTKALRVASFSVVDGSGKLLSKAALSIRGPGEPQGGILNMPEGRGEAIVPAGNLHLVASAPGFRTRELETDGDERIVLTRGYPVRLVLTGVDMIRDAGYSMHAFLKKDGRTVSTTGEVGAGQTTTVHASMTGELELQVFVLHVTERGVRRSALDWMTRRTAEVLDARAEQTFTFDFTAQAVLDTLERLRN